MRVVLISLPSFAAFLEIRRLSTISIMLLVVGRANQMIWVLIICREGAIFDPMLARLRALRTST